MITKEIFNRIPDQIKSILTKYGICDLYPPQAQAVEYVLDSNRNLLLSMPTASGKTLIAEILILQNLLKQKGNCLYIVPLKALASEKYEDFKEKYSALGFRVGIATGDFDKTGEILSKNHILISTAEKVDSLLRQNPHSLCAVLSCVVIDEIHYVGDNTRGPTLETVITRLRTIRKDLRILG